MYDTLPSGPRTRIVDVGGQVRKGAGKNGEDISVPISASYNHHYNLNIIGAASRFKKVNLTGPDDPNAAVLAAQSHGEIQYDQEYYIVEKLRESETGQRSSLFITSGNGGEYRKTAHRFAPGYGVVLDSPTALQDSPMQIDSKDLSQRLDLDTSLFPLPTTRTPMLEVGGDWGAYWVSCKLRSSSGTRISNSVLVTHWNRFDICNRAPPTVLCPPPARRPRSAPVGSLACAPCGRPRSLRSLEPCRDGHRRPDSAQVHAGPAPGGVAGPQGEPRVQRPFGVPDVDSDREGRRRRLRGHVGGYGNFDLIFFRTISRAILGSNPPRTARAPWSPYCPC